MKSYFKIIGLGLLPAILLYIGKEDYIFNLLVTKTSFFVEEDKNNFMNSSFILGLLFSNLIIPFQLATAIEKKNKMENNFHLFLKNTKDYFTHALDSELKLGDIEINIRIFLPKKGVKAYCRKKNFKEVSFQINNIKGLADDNLTDDLCFQVAPIPEGIVGLTYANKNIIYDTALRSADQKVTYNLNDYQISHTSDAEFVAATPIFNSSNKVVAIVTIDSRDKINFTNDSARIFRDVVIKYCKLIDRFLPHVKS